MELFIYLIKFQNMELEKLPYWCSSLHCVICDNNQLYCENLVVPFDSLCFLVMNLFKLSSQPGGRVRTPWDRQAPAATPAAQAPSSATCPGSIFHRRAVQQARNRPVLQEPLSQHQAIQLDHHIQTMRPYIGRNDIPNINTDSVLNISELE